MPYKIIPVLNDCGVRKEYAKELQAELGAQCSWDFFAVDSMPGIEVYQKPGIRLQSKYASIKQMYVVGFPHSIGGIRVVASNIMIDDVSEFLVGQRGYERISDSISSCFQKSLSITAQLLFELSGLEAMVEKK